MPGKVVRVTDCINTWFAELPMCLVQLIRREVDNSDDFELQLRAFAHDYAEDEHPEFAVAQIMFGLDDFRWIDRSGRARPFLIGFLGHPSYWPHAEELVVQALHAAIQSSIAFVSRGRTTEQVYDDAWGQIMEICMFDKCDQLGLDYMLEWAFRASEHILEFEVLNSDWLDDLWADMERRCREYILERNVQWKLYDMNTGGSSVADM